MDFFSLVLLVKEFTIHSFVALLYRRLVLALECALDSRRQNLYKASKVNPGVKNRSALHESHPSPPSPPRAEKVEQLPRVAEGN